jgi:hypothetical protein
MLRKPVALKKRQVRRFAETDALAFFSLPMARLGGLRGEPSKSAMSARFVFSSNKPDDIERWRYIARAQVEEVAAIILSAFHILYVNGCCPDCPM